MTRFLMSVAACFTLSTASQSIAQSGDVMVPPTDPIALAQFLEDLGASERIDQSGKLQMLSQRIPAAACAHHAGIASEQSKVALHDSMAEFDTIIAALEYGDVELNIIGPEQDRQTLTAIAAVHAAYDPLHAYLDDIEASGGTDEEVHAIAEHDMEVLSAAQLLVSEVAGHYADPTTLLQADAMSIDIAGRQRMLSQKISKEVCLITSGIHAEQSIEALASSINMFEMTLNALIFGMDAVGVAPAPTDEILAGLQEVQADWVKISNDIKSVSTGGAVDDDTRNMIFTGLDQTMADMNVVVNLYSENSKLGL